MSKIQMVQAEQAKKESAYWESQKTGEGLVSILLWNIYFNRFNGKIKGRGNSKNGNRYLSMAFVEAAHYATIWNPVIKRYYQRKCKHVPVMVQKGSGQ